MATPEQIEQVSAMLEQAQPTALFKKMDDTWVGIGAVLRFLELSTDEAVTAGSIAEFMGVSAARVTALLKKMTAQGLILRESSAADARVSLVRLSQKGKEEISVRKAMLNCHVGLVIDRIGWDRLMDFLAISGEIHSVILETRCQTNPCEKGNDR